jgi:peptidoglycan-associated lipoprotein
VVFPRRERWPCNNLADNNLAPADAFPDNAISLISSRLSMKLFSSKLTFVLIGAAVLLAGCPKKPRPSPDQTVLSGNQGAVPPTAVDAGGPPTGLVPNDTTGDKFANAERGILPTVYFDFDRSGIKQSERPKLEQAAKWLADNKGKRVLLEGHCDWRGTAEYNLGLGDRRANAVKEYLQKLGVDVTRLEVVSKGDLDAKEHGTESEMSKDRRVELAVLK